MDLLMSLTLKAALMPGRVRLTRSWRVINTYKCYAAASLGLLLTGLLFVSIATAQDLLQVYEIARVRDPVLQQQEANRQATYETIPQARALLRPNVNFQAGLSQTFQDVSIPGSATNGFRGGSFQYVAENYSLNITQPVFHFDSLVQLKQADHQVKQVEAQYAAAIQDLIIRVSDAYFNTLAAKDSLDFAIAETQALKQQLEQARQRMDVGLSTINDVQEAQSGYDSAFAREIQARNQLDNSREALREITGEYQEKFAVLKETMPLVAPEPADITLWTKKALEQNLSIMAAQSGVEVALAETKKRQAGHLPTLDIVGSHSFSSSGGRFGTQEVTNSAIGLQLNVPIYQGGLVNSRVREGQHRYHAALDQLEQQRRAAQRLTHTAYLNVTAGISQVKALHQAVLSNQTSVDATKAGVEVGTRTGVDLVVAQRGLFQAKRDYARARYDYALNLLRLKQATGTLSPDDLARVNRWLVE
jgi:outer membrane protein